MPGTIEIIGSNLDKKINVLLEVINFSSDFLEKGKKNKVMKIKKNLETIETDYDVNTVNILTKYHEFINKNQNRGDYFFNAKSDFLTRYRVIITQKNFFGKIGRIKFLLSREIYFEDDKKRAKIDSLFKIFDNIPQHVEENTPKKLACEQCKKEMDVTPSTSQCFCRKCGLVDKLEGTVFEDEQFFHQEGQRTKHGNYETNKHCKIWVGRIQARESKKIPPSLIAKLNRCIKMDGIIDSERVTCERIREYLRQLKKTKFNEHIPLIRQLLTGKVPPQLTDIELRKLSIWFDKVITIFGKIKPPEKTNCPYHPYFIYKILDIMVEDVGRKKEILSCIHLQSRETVIENDKEWKKICSRIPKFKNKYRPTNRYANVMDY